jgi:hypothetical protein
MPGNGYLKSVSQDPVAIQFPLAATLNRIGGHSRVAVYGHHPSPVTAGADVWEGGGAYPFQAAATVLEILSASANDTAAGTGARTFLLQGLDANYNVISETLTMAGVTPVQTVNSYLRVNSLNIVSAGSGQVNAGDITLRVTGAGATQAIARAGYGYAKQAIYTVPAGFTLLVTDLLLECGGTGTASVITFSFTRINAFTGNIIQTTSEYLAGPLFPVQRSVIVGAMVQQRTTLTTRVKAVTGTEDGFSAFEGILVDNTQLV